MQKTKKACWFSGPSSTSLKDFIEFSFVHKKATTPFPGAPAPGTSGLPTVFQKFPAGPEPRRGSRSSRGPGPQEQLVEPLAWPGGVPEVVIIIVSQAGEPGPWELLEPQDPVLFNLLETPK